MIKPHLSVFCYMGIGVLITAFVTMFISNSPDLMGLLFNTYEHTNEDGEVTTGFSASWIWWTCVAVELALVIGICYGTNNLSAGISWIMFLVYAGLNGITLSPLIYVYTGESITVVFFLSAAVFGVAAAYGFFTKRDMTSLGSFFMVGLISLIIAMVVNIFIGSSFMGFVISCVAVLLFLGITAFDIQMLREMHNQQYGNSEKSLAVYGALSLYLDFINIFIHMLRIWGNLDD